eukprot:10940298-Alexandrium_andersonii.AAC.1
MSASLVGSEMCIRDRIAAVVSTAALSPKGRAERTPWGVHRRFAISASTVSYTHLTLPTICSV